ncbi:flagellar hook protein FlgE [Aquitalea sp. LB_tupeE]|uniref:flagellar hook protein FlgE n=1 Tax=Aquitalea sp. LB_tupeE TaxID=2748078 RepID=UPI0015B8F3FE|nr:flagellar hook protein FlgE [Aquitalea sp. LB_tupeE]NWK79135.1 flagellar hook protein FlgE [Aquitalea sp. LB_tupeE]
MGFQQGLSGLNSASSQLDTIGNNVSNASTVGFKSSRTEFSDLFSTSFYGVASTSAGIGSQVSAVTQSFSAGNITPTGRSLDLAINNNGFFIVRQNPTSSTGSLAYTRNGQFQVDKDGYIVNGNDRLQGWMANNGVVTQGPVTDLKLQTNLISPAATTKVTMGVNVDSRLTTPTVTPLDPTNTKTFNWSNAAQVYDSLGNQHNLTLYYVKGTATTSGTPWTVTAYVDGNPATTPNTYTMNYDTSGNLTNTTPFSVTFSPTPVNGSSSPVTLSIDYTGSTQVAQASGTPTETVDGYAPGTLSSMNIDTHGNIMASFSNGQNKVIGQVALATFTNSQGLQNEGGNRWQQTLASGVPAYNAPGSGNAGTVQSQALEDSNVDLTAELVNMITAQRFYQANAQTIKTEDTLMQTIINL